MNEQQYAQALSRHLDMIAGFKQCINVERTHGTDLGVRQYEHLVRKLFVELDELMTMAPGKLKHEVVIHHE
ncbi:hypothetical protein ACFSUS_27635 [Spirosoma soli]|uniref:Uncharacterized protein n=1 Tax=Spirosoma soli TaxID=1770529 RepID=A0ABW5MDS9_9BACT